VGASSSEVRVGSVAIGGGAPLAVIAGPCVIESRDAALRHAERLKTLAAEAGVGLVYKSSFDKANRTSIGAFRGVGMDEGLRILDDVRRATGLPVLTDVHEVGQIAAVAGVVDVLQTPAFLCRQTDFIVAVAQAGKPVNLKKAQFLSPSESACSGSSCTSMKTASQPAATAARASGATKRRSPPDCVPSPPGCCTLWVAS